jgi:hypothetical protein
LNVSSNTKLGAFQQPNLSPHTELGSDTLWAGLESGREVRPAQCVAMPELVNSKSKDKAIGILTVSALQLCGSHTSRGLTCDLIEVHSTLFSKKCDIIE